MLNAGLKARPPLSLRAVIFFGNLALSGVAIVVVLLLLEGGVRLLAPQDLDFYNAENIMRPSTRSGQAFEFIPNSANASYIGVPVRINSLGLRDQEVAIPKPAGVFRVLALGDSVTFGFGVRLEETYVKRLEARLNAHVRASTRRIEVINAGIEGVGFNYYGQFLRSTGPRLQPDLLLVGIVLNDIVEYRERRAGGDDRRQWTSTARSLNRFMRLHSHLYAYASSRLKSILYRTGVFDINRMYADNFLTLGAPSERQSRAWTSSLARLDELLALAGRLDVPVVLVLFPMEVQLSAEMRDLYRRVLGIKLNGDAVFGAPQRRLAEFARARDVPLVDLLPRFRASQVSALFLRNKVISHDWAHPSPAGHDVAADEIFRVLRSLGLVPTAKRYTVGGPPPAHGGAAK